MFVIMHQTGLYFHNKGKIILFKSQQEAQSFLEMFINYSTNRLAQDGDMMAVMQVPIVAMHQCAITPVDFDIENVECGTVFAEELFEKMEY